MSIYKQQQDYLLEKMNEPAFPLALPNGYYEKGITIKQYYASIAMQSLISRIGSHLTSHELEHLVKVSFTIAEKMIEHQARPVLDQMEMNYHLRNSSTDTANLQQHETAQFNVPFRSTESDVKTLEDEL